MTKPSMTRTWLLVASLAVFGTVSTAHGAILSSPAKSRWGCELSSERVLLGINAGLVSKDWVMKSKDTKGHVVAEINVRNKHKLTVDINYTTTTFQITYKSSENLNYKVKDDGSIIIHNNANKWMRTLGEYIEKQLDSLCDF